METGIIKYLDEKFELEVPVDITQEQLEIILAQRINYLIANDFNRLVQILYRIDVREQKLKELLKQNPGADAGRIIAALVIERQLEKKKSREQFRNDSNNFTDEEKW